MRGALGAPALGLALLVAACGSSSSGRPPTAPPPGDVRAPELLWARGGCFASWCQTGWYASPAVVDLDGDASTKEIV